MCTGAAGTAGQAAVRFEIERIETPHRLHGFFWRRTFVLDPSAPSTPAAVHRLSWPDACPPGASVECVETAYADADRALNAAYAEARRRLSRSRFAALRADQRAWLAGRDPGCAAEVRASAAWAAETVEALCLYTETRDRTGVLRASVARR